MVTFIGAQAESYKLFHSNLAQLLEGSRLKFAPEYSSLETFLDVITNLNLSQAASSDFRDGQA